MADFSIVLDAETLERKPGRPVVGDIHLTFDGHAFPSDDWSDFALEFIGNYIHAVLQLRTRKRSSVEFFEGPFRLRLTRDGTLVKVEGLKGNKVLHTAEMPFAELLEHTVLAILPWIEHEQAVGC
jgi:hypothetical protein